MHNLDQWLLEDLIDRVLNERLVDQCVQKDDYVVIVQGSTRFVLDPERAHAFLRGIIRGMSPEYRWRSWFEESQSSHPESAMPDAPADAGERSGLFHSFRRRLIEKWWGRYEQAGCPFGRSVGGLIFWIRHDASTTAN